jgi:hypothetical protein
MTTPMPSRYSKGFQFYLKSLIKHANFIYIYAFEFNNANTLLSVRIGKKILCIRVREMKDRKLNPRGICIHKVDIQISFHWPSFPDKVGVILICNVVKFYLIIEYWYLTFLTSNVFQRCHSVYPDNTRLMLPTFK